MAAVLDDIRRRGIRDMVNLGDSLYGPLDPAGTARILLGLDMAAVSGNEDRIILEGPGRHPGSPSLPFVQAALQPEHFRWLERLPCTAVAFGDFLLCHGTPESDHDYLLREVTAHGCRPLPAELVEMRLATVSQKAVLCGHDHLPAWLRLPDGGQVIDPGSVGLPAYRDDLPFPHAMEAGSPHARYSVVTGGRGGPGSPERRRALRLGRGGAGGRTQRPPRLGGIPAQRPRILMSNKPATHKRSQHEKTDFPT